jgi:hypothetical protein
LGPATNRGTRDAVRPATVPKGIGVQASPHLPPPLIGAHCLPQSYRSAASTPGTPTTIDDTHRHPLNPIPLFIFPTFSRSHQHHITHHSRHVQHQSPVRQGRADRQGAPRRGAAQAHAGRSAPGELAWCGVVWPVAGYPALTDHDDGDVEDEQTRTRVEGQGRAGADSPSSTGTSSRPTRATTRLPVLVSAALVAGSV